MSSHASMNHIYRLVFNAATGMYVAVAETAKGRGKAGRSASAAMLAALTAIGGAGGLSNAGAQNVLPTGGAVASGSASISQTASAMTIDQTSNAAILNWQSFSIGAANSVRFNQPSASSIALNRVIGNSASEILGGLSANGKVMLVNQNGILMGSGAQVNTGGFIGSTLNIKDSDFLAGRYIFDIANNTGGTAGNIINNGRTNTPSGYVVLIAPQVTNNGFIAARQGTVAIGAGNKVSLDMVGDGLIGIKVDQAALHAAIVNTGSINANGGTVLLKASSANALFDTVINSTGIIRADSIANVNGRIILDGGATGITEVTGEITARGLNAGETGGQISVLGDKVGLLGNAKLDASGDAGGGTVLVGGNWQGNGPERNASRTIVGSNASIDVGATNNGNGNGGTVVVWSDGRTDMSGTIKAAGGVYGGNGGNVETSGKAALDLQGRVDITAANGQGGQWLLDPNDIEITNATANATTAGTTYQDDAGAANATVSAAALGAALTGGATVNVQTSNSGTSGGTGSITVTDAITATGAATLNLIANGAITVNAAIANAGGSALNVGLYAGSTGTPASIATAGGQAGAITTAAAGTITTNGGKVTMVSGSDLTLGGAINTARGDVTLKAGGALAINQTVNTDTGTVRLQSTGAITQTVDGVISATNLGARGASVELATAPNLVAGNVALNASAGVAKYSSGYGLNVDSVTADGTLFTATTGVRTNNQDVTLVANGSVDLLQAVNAGTGTVRLQTTGSLDQFTDGVITAANLGVRATYIQLAEASNAVTNDVALHASSSTIKFNNGSGFNVGAITADGTLFAATTGVSTNNQNITLNAGGPLAINQAVNAGTGTVRLQSTGAITQAIAGVITAANLGARGTAVNLSTAANAVSNNVGINASAGHVLYKSTSGFNLGSVTQDNFTSLFDVDTAGMTAAGANNNVTIESAGAVTQSAGSDVTAAGLLIQGAGAFTLTNTTNSVTNIAAETGAGAVKYVNAGTLTVGTVGTTDGMTRTGNVAVNAQTGDLNLTKAINADAGQVRLQAVAGNIDQTAGVITAGALGVNAGGDVLMGTSSNAASVVGLKATGDVNYKSANGYTIGSVGADAPVFSANVSGMRTTGAGKNITLDTAAGTVTEAGMGSNITTTATGGLELKGAAAYTLTDATNSVGKLAASTGAGNISYSNAGALEIGTVNTVGITRTGNVTLQSGGTVSQTAALTQTGGGAVSVTATAGTVKLTNTANDVSGVVNLSATAGGVAFVNNNAAGIRAGDITAATSVNSINASSIANFTASDTALTGVVLLQALQGNIERSGATKIVADRTVLVAANRIGGATAADAALGMLVEGAAGVSAREVYLSAGATQIASVFGPATVPLFYKNLMDGATALPSPASSTYNGVAVDFNPAAAQASVPAAAQASVSANNNDAARLRLAQAIAQNQGLKLNQFETELNPGVTAKAKRANTQLDDDLRNAARAEIIVAPSCAPGAARPAAPGQC